MLQKIPSTDTVIVDLRYATIHNFTGKSLYDQIECYLHQEAATLLSRADVLAKSMGYGLRIFDAFRPTEAQWKLWAFCPNPNYIADPEKGSPHSRGVAVDLTLVDLATMEDLDMGTPFDDFTEKSHHACLDITPEQQKNRALLLGIMTASGWDLYKNEWWHYQLFDAKSYPLLSAADAPGPLIMAAA